MSATVFQSAESRPLGLRHRADLIVQSLWLRGRKYWNLKDPISLAYFQLRDEEFVLWRMLDGQISLEQLQRVFERQFAPRKLSLTELQGFLGMLHEHGLVVSARTGQGLQLLARRRKQGWQKFWQTLGNPLAIRFRGVDPHRFFDVLHARCGWLFSRGMVTLSLTAILLTALWAAIRFPEVSARMPDFAAFFTLQSAPLFLLAIALSKVLHELGHGLACRRFGGECHELGLMLLCFTPCLYCNVSDSWMLPSRWRRAAVGAAGMYVELILAAGCFWLWWFSAPGVLNAIALKIAFVASAGTLLLNANPLLRYDGYFILSDLIETPNLQQQGAGLLSSTSARWMLGIDTGNDRTLPERNRPAFALYAILSLIYRWLVVVGLLWFFYRAAQPYRAEVVVALLGTLVIAAMVATPAIQGVRSMALPGRMQEVAKRRATIWLLLLLGVGCALFALRLPYRISAPAVVEYAGAKPVYVTAPGRILEAVAIGDQLERGQQIALLADAQFEWDLARIRLQRDQIKLKMVNLERRRIDDPGAELQLATARASLADLEEQLRQRELDAQRLKLLAPQSGSVLPTRRTPPRDRPGELNSWRETPLELQNRGAFLETGTLVCSIGDPHRFEATLLLDQADLEFVHESQSVQIRLNDFPELRLSGQIVEISMSDRPDLPGDVAARREQAAGRDDGGQAKPAANYQARVKLDQHDLPLVNGAPGRSIIEADWQPLGKRLIRFFQSTFDFRR